MQSKPKQINKKKEKQQRKNPYSKCRSNCAVHKFIFKPKSDNLYHGQTKISYCPLYSDRTENFESIIPKINPDAKKYYPLFCIDLDRDHYIYHEEKYKEEHEKKVTDYMQQKEDLYEPKPGRKTKWCAVCKQQYDDYLEHVRDKQHSQQSKNNHFIKEIGKIAQQYSDKHKQTNDVFLQSVKQNSEETINKENISTTIENNDLESEQEVIILNNDPKNDQIKQIGRQQSLQTQELYQKQPSILGNQNQKFLNQQTSMQNYDIIYKTPYGLQNNQQFQEDNNNLFSSNPNQIPQNNGQIGMYQQPYDNFYANRITCTPIFQNSNNSHPQQQQVQQQIIANNSYNNISDIQQQNQQNKSKKRQHKNSNGNSNYGDNIQKKIKVIDLTSNEQYHNLNQQLEHQQQQQQQQECQQQIQQQLNIYNTMQQQAQLPVIKSDFNERWQPAIKNIEQFQINMLSQVMPNQQQLAQQIPFIAKY